VAEREGFSAPLRSASKTRVKSADEGRNDDLLGAIQDSRCERLALLQGFASGSCLLLCKLWYAG
jgi:hypothetical protein